jgi:hypothetical protein
MTPAYELTASSVAPNQTTSSSSPTAPPVAVAASREKTTTHDLESGSTTRPPLSADQAELKGPDGYQKLADMMGALPNHAIFRRFGWLSTLNLMRLQAELAKLEFDLKKCQRADQEAQHRLGLKLGETYATSFEALTQNQSDQDPEQLVLMKKSASVLQEYSQYPPKCPLWPILTRVQMPCYYRPHRLLLLANPEMNSRTFWRVGSYTRAAATIFSMVTSCSGPGPDRINHPITSFLFKPRSMIQVLPDCSSRACEPLTTGLRNIGDGRR